MGPTEDAELVPVMDHGIPLGVPLVVATGLQSLLRGFGIEAVVSGYRAEPVLPFRLLVSSAEVERASQVIAEALSGGAAAADEAELAGEAAGDIPPDGMNLGWKGVL